MHVMCQLIFQLTKESYKISDCHPRKYEGPYTSQRAPGIMSIALLVIGQQLKCCLHLKKSKSTCFHIRSIGLHV